MSLARALELGAAAQGRAYPKPTVGAALVRDGDSREELLVRTRGGSLRSLRLKGNAKLRGKLPPSSKRTNFFVSFSIGSKTISR